MAPRPTPADSVIPIDWSTRPSSSIATHSDGEVAAGAAPLLGEHDAEESEVAHLPHDVDGEVMFAVPLRGVRSDLGLGELAHGRPQQVVLGRQLPAHCCTSLRSLTGSTRRSHRCLAAVIVGSPISPFDADSGRWCSPTIAASVAPVDIDRASKS